MRVLDILVNCESSGAIRSRLRALGHKAWSCDLLPADDGSPYHIQGDALAAGRSRHWDLMIAHPPCTHLAVSGARWFPQKRADGSQQAALQFVRDLMALPIEFKVIENPVSIISSQIRKSDQTVQPWMFGDFETKATCLWLENLPPLVPTYRTVAEAAEAAGLPANSKPEARIWKLPPSADRWKLRSKTYDGIARAAALQWSAHVANIIDNRYLQN